MKITDKNNVRSMRKEPKSPSTKSNSGLFSLFSSELDTKQNLISQYDSDISELRTDLDTAGQALEQEPTIKNFKRFRDLLSKVAKKVSAEAYRLNFN